MRQVIACYRATRRGAGSGGEAFFRPEDAPEPDEPDEHGEDGQEPDSDIE